MNRIRHFIRKYFIISINCCIVWFEYVLLRFCASKCKTLHISSLSIFYLKLTWTLKTLCIGVKCNKVSACTPHWSNVERVRSSQMFFVGHQSAWSDQSFGFSEIRNNENKMFRMFHLDTWMQRVNCFNRLDSYSDSSENVYIVYRKTENRRIKKTSNQLKIWCMSVGIVFLLFGINTDHIGK